MSLARWIMDRATANPPKGREEWAAAMRAEFEALESGRLGWAMGCWRTMAGWRLRSEWLFLLALVAIPLAVVGFAAPLTIFALAIVLPQQLFRDLFFPLGFLGLATGAALLAFWRPDRVSTASVMAWLVALAHGWFGMTMMISDGPAEVRSGAFDNWELYNAPPLVGALAMLAACWVGASVGAAVKSGFERAMAIR